MPKQTEYFERLAIAVAESCSLTGRRSAVLELTAQGLSSKEIARKLGIQPETVDRHIDALKEQFGAINRADLISQGWMHGILQARAAVRALVLFLAILSAGPAIRTGRTVRTPTSRTAQTVVRIQREGVQT
mgnify:CR=1 FL=1